MGQLKQNFLSRASSSDRGGTSQPDHLVDSIQTLQELPRKPQEQEADEAILSVSPPPLPWPRVFPPL